MSTATRSRTPVVVRGAMEAYVFCGEGRQLEWVAVPEVDLEAGEVLASIELATICGSDVHTVSGDRRAPTPLVLGHEQVGRVVALGSGRPARAVDGTPIAVGDRIVWGVAVDCGRCRYCRAGLPQKCLSLVKYGHERVRRGWELSGGFATHAHLRARTPLVRVPEELPASVAAPAACATATVMAALDAASAIRPLEGAVVAISGCGMLGLTAIAAAVARGASVVASDPDARRRAAAREFGALAVADGSREGLAAALGSVRARHGFTIGIELSGATSGVASLVDAADIGGVVVLVGSVFPAGTVAVDPEQLVRRMITIRGVHNYAPQHLAQAIDFLAGADAEAFAELVGEERALDDIESAMRLARAGGTTRVAVRPTPRPVELS